MYLYDISMNVDVDINYLYIFYSSCDVKIDWAETAQVEDGSEL